MRLLGLSCGGDGDLTGEPPPDSKSDIGPKRSNCEDGGTSGEDGGGGVPRARPDSSAGSAWRARILAAAVVRRRVGAIGVW